LKSRFVVQKSFSAGRKTVKTLLATLTLLAGLTMAHANTIEPTAPIAPGWKCWIERKDKLPPATLCSKSDKRIVRHALRRNVR
jgi:hypothetical protein